ncbi:BCCT family transporter [Leucobacter aridicollis]|uniref:Choline/glycine/proline betaine transport protein n=1 Tax=Leucobacter aridicollis TaxID=283878 RepID=A0A852QWT8_9MICO|nr:choline/glycine/proline betaine transport protein [Leucobacter aridicollis]
MSSTERTPPGHTPEPGHTPPEPQPGAVPEPQDIAAEAAPVQEPPATTGALLLEPGDLDLPDTVHLHEAVQINDDDSDERITAKLRTHGVRIGKGMISPRVFWPALVIILVLVAYAAFWPNSAEATFSSVQGWIVENLGWYYMLIVAAFIAIAATLGFSRLGRIRLGRDDDEPEFGLLSWFSMLFAAGMGIGLVFYGVGEPLTYATVDPKPGWEGSQAEIAGLAMAQTFVHWGIHPWAIYAIIGLSIAYAIHRRGRPVSIRWALEPLFGERVKGWTGDVIDVLAILGTVFGVATSLGLGVQQISAGMLEIGIVDRVDNTTLVVLIIAVTLVAMFSVISGIGAGMKWLSNINLSLAGALLISLLLLGPTLFLFQNLTESLGFYLANFMQMTFDVGAFQRGEGTSWFANWTIFYWGWWISWSPFVGIFIARISRGRTVREFVAGVMLVPTFVGILWFSVLGGSGLFRQFFGAGDLVEDGKLDVDSVLFKILGDLPLGTMFSVVGILLVAIFFITSSDSGSLVVDMLASGGHPNPPTWSRVLWSVIEGLVAIALLLAGGLKSLQAAALATALPFSVILLLMAFATVKALRIDDRVLERAERTARIERLTEHMTTQFAERIGDNQAIETYVDDRIDYRISRTRGAFPARRTTAAQPAKAGKPAKSGKPDRTDRHGKR